MPLIVPSRNPLVYPAGLAPGFDPSHVASVNPIISTVAQGGSHINILTGGLPSSTVGSPTAAINGLAGPGMNCPASAYRGFTNSIPLLSINGPLTLAGIFFNNNATADRALIGIGTANPGWSLVCGAANNYIFIGGFGQWISTFTTVAGGTYFFVGSANATAANFALTNLTTGQIQIKALTGSKTPSDRKSVV